MDVSQFVKNVCDGKIRANRIWRNEISGGTFTAAAAAPTTSDTFIGRQAVKTAALLTNQELKQAAAGKRA